jgi:hypothetical protein
MNHMTALKLRELHKGKHCDKHVFIKETYAGLETGDYACIRCGHEISKEEFKKLKDKNSFQVDLFITGNNHKQTNRAANPH